MQICLLKLLCLALMRTLDICLCRMQCHTMAPELGLVQRCQKMVQCLFFFFARLLTDNCHVNKNVLCETKCNLKSQYIAQLFYGQAITDTQFLLPHFLGILLCPESWWWDKLPCKSDGWSKSFHWLISGELVLCIDLLANLNFSKWRKRRACSSRFLCCNYFLNEADVSLENVNVLALWDVVLILWPLIIKKYHYQYLITHTLDLKISHV